MEIPAGLESWLQVAARKERRTVSQLVAQALEVYRSEGQVIESVLAIGRRKAAPAGRASRPASPAAGRRRPS